MVKDATGKAKREAGTEWLTGIVHSEAGERVSVRFERATCWSGTAYPVSDLIVLRGPTFDGGMLRGYATALALHEVAHIIAGRRGAYDHGPEFAKIAAGLYAKYGVLKEGRLFSTQLGKRYIEKREARGRKR